MTCGRRRFDAAMVRFGAAADKCASCGYACRDLGGGVSCSSGVTTAAEVQQLLRFAAECTPWSEISDFRFVAMRRLAASLRRGGSAGRASVRLSIVWTLHANLNVTPVLHELRLHVERRAARTRGSRFRPARHQETSPTPRGAVALLLRRGLLPGCKSQTHGSTGAPRVRWARPELGKDPDVTPD